jgi:hypothetical protein
MTVLDRIKTNWRKPKKKAAAPKPTSADRQAAIDKLAEIDAQRPQVDVLQKAADKARDDRDAAKVVADAAKDAYASAQGTASRFGASLDNQARRQRNVLRRTCSPLISEFVETVSGLLYALRNDGVLRSAPVSGKFTVDGHAHKQPWSTFATAGERSSALVLARREAESMRFLPLTEEQVEERLERLFSEVPQVDYQHC